MKRIQKIYENNNGWWQTMAGRIKLTIFFKLQSVGLIFIIFILWKQQLNCSFPNTSCSAFLTQAAHLSLHFYNSSTLAASTIQLQPQPVGHTVSFSNHDIMCSECPPWPHTTQKLDNPMEHKIGCMNCFCKNSECYFNATHI